MTDLDAMIVLMGLLLGVCALTSGSPAKRHKAWIIRMCRAEILGSSFQPWGIDARYYPSSLTRGLAYILVLVDAFTWPLTLLWKQTLGRPVVQTVIWHVLVGFGVVLGVALIIVLAGPSLQMGLFGVFMQ